MISPKDSHALTCRGVSETVNERGIYQRPGAAPGSAFGSPPQLRSPDVEPIRRDAHYRSAVAEEDPEQFAVRAVVGPVFGAIRCALDLPGVAELAEHLPP